MPRPSPPPRDDALTPSLSQRERGRGVPLPRPVDDEREEAAFETAAGWLEELGETGGKSGAAVRAFAALFPPVTHWGEPWPDGADAEALPPFRPAAASYASALREVAAGRRRVRVAGRWDDGPGKLTIGLVGPAAAATWAVVEAEPRQSSPEVPGGSEP